MSTPQTSTTSATLQKHYLTATGLSRAFGKHSAVVHANITLTPGRITGLVGPNGAGKTTLLLLLAGLLSPDTGDIEINGAITSSVELRKITGWMPDVFGTWESLTTQEILTTFARLHGQETKAARQRANELLRLVHLSEFSRRPAHELSRGQKQRLGFARALVNNPQVLLLDEPASAMDPRSRKELRNQLRILADNGCAILVSSHILTELSEMVDDIVIMTGGQTHIYSPAETLNYRVRRVGQATDAAEILSFADENAAAAHLSELISKNIPVVEFSCTSNQLEDTYLALDPVRQ